MKKLTVSVGIPAYNEENNISNILHDLISQKLDSVFISKIYVISDKSTDKTDKIVSTFRFNKIVLVKNTKQLGKSGSIKKLLKRTKKISDITVVIDADIRLKDKFVIEKLLHPFLNNKNLLITSGRVIPYKPKNFIERVGYLNIKVWDRIIKGKKGNNDYYRCSDQLLAINNRLVAVSELKAEFMHDEYYFLLAMKSKLQFRYVAAAVAFYHLPSTIHDYLHQMVRFLANPKTVNTYFDEKFIAQYQTVGTMDKIRALSKIFLSEPLISIGYVTLQTWANVQCLLSRSTPTPVWQPVVSTK